MPGVVAQKRFGVTVCWQPNLHYAALPPLSPAMAASMVSAAHDSESSAPLLWPDLTLRTVSRLVRIVTQLFQFAAGEVWRVLPSDQQAGITYSGSSGRRQFELVAFHSPMDLVVRSKVQSGSVAHAHAR
jgi:hypothetical protein